MRHSIDRATDMLYWPILDLFLIGVTGAYFATYAPDSPIVPFVLAGAVFWLLVVRGQYEISGSILEEVWNRNLINIFASPLSLAEWLTASVIVSFLKGLVALTFAIAIALLAFHVNLAALLGWQLIPIALLLLASGWTVGLLIGGVILRFGSKFQALAWSLVWAFSPFAGLYAPTSVLPHWAQAVSSFLPMSYAFETGRSLIAHTPSPAPLAIGWGLAAIYFAAGLFFFYRSFRRSLQKGLNKLL